MSEHLPDRLAGKGSRLSAQPARLPARSANLRRQSASSPHHALLARVAAKLRTADNEVQAAAGIYLELVGDLATASEYYRKAGSGFTETLGGLFE